MTLRIGHGIDIHRLVEGREFVLGGVLIPHAKGPLGHSDGDVLLHALVDALLGAAAQGDIGSWFPDTDPRWKGVDSRDLVKDVWRELRRSGWKLVNLDSTVITEEPKLRPYIDELRQSLATLLECDISQCSVKAKTAEKLGEIGAAAAISATCVVLLERAV